MCQNSLFAQDEGGGANGMMELQEREHKKTIRQPCVCCRILDLPTVRVEARRCHDPRLCVHLINKSDNGDGDDDDDKDDDNDDEDEDDDADGESSSIELVMTSREVTFMIRFLNDFGRVLVGHQPDLWYLRNQGYNLCRNVDVTKDEGCQVGVKWTGKDEQSFIIYDIDIDYDQHICLAPKDFFRLVCHVDGLLKLTKDHAQEMTSMLFSQMPFPSFDNKEWWAPSQQQALRVSGCVCITGKRQLCICRVAWTNSFYVVKARRCHDDRFCVHLIDEEDWECVVITSVCASKIVKHLPMFAKCLLDQRAHNRGGDKHHHCFLDDTCQNSTPVTARICFVILNSDQPQFAIYNRFIQHAIMLSPRFFFKLVAFLTLLLNLTNHDED